MLIKCSIQILTIVVSCNNLTVLTDRWTQTYEQTKHLLCMQPRSLQYARPYPGPGPALVLTLTLAALAPASAYNWPHGSRLVSTLYKFGDKMECVQIGASLGGMGEVLYFKSYSGAGEYSLI